MVQSTSETQSSRVGASPLQASLGGLVVLVLAAGLAAGISRGAQTSGARARGPRGSGPQYG